ncbi:MAG: aminopeptidase N [Alphaproteobacteria bacterium]
MLYLLRPSFDAAPPRPTLLADYAPPDFLISTTRLDVQIHDDHARVHATLHMRRNPVGKRSASLVLDGLEQELLEVRLDGQVLPAGAYQVTARHLTLADLPDQFCLEIISTHQPQKNTALSGFYKSGTMLCTQCEAEGFRRITYYLDRPDVLARFDVRIEADARTYPVLLANGNLQAKGKVKGGRHWVEWHDPFPKPCYLFAMVAGDLQRVPDKFTTKSGRKVLLEIYVEPGNTDQVKIALRSLKAAMKWDEDAYNLEYDLDRFMIVATSFFNMGAMENKGLNIFNSDCVLARPETATDADIAFVERVVGHEYFHNWTGNRITCRDWFQLSLKEGLTVFREQQFVEAMNSPAVERVRETRNLRVSQFTEDAGPNAHPVRPESFLTIDNFYTATVYSKGAEVCRMLHTLLGDRRWQRGMQLYVKRHDGGAATCDDFVAAMADASKLDLGQFKLWYSQAGTPLLQVKGTHDAKAQTYTLRIKQSCPPTPGQPKKLPMHVPFAVGLLDKEGRDLIGTEILQLHRAEETFVFKDIPTPPIPSLLRQFSAPVRVDFAYQEKELLFLLAHDHDSFSRWDAGQTLFNRVLQRLVATYHAGRKPQPPKAFIAALGPILEDPHFDPAFTALMLQIPGDQEIAAQLADAGKTVDVVAVHKAREFLRAAIGKAHLPLFRRRWRALQPDPYAVDGQAMGMRSLKNLCLAYMAAGGEHAALAEAAAQVRKSPNMTDQISALNILVWSGDKIREKALAQFYARWRDDELVINKWFAVQAAAPRRDTLARVKALLRHPDFDRTNPNKLRAVLGTFAHNNPFAFHASGGAGYKFLATQIRIVDKINPQMASRLAHAFDRCRMYDPVRQKQMRAALESLQAMKGLSANTYEIVSKSLAHAKGKTK